MDGSCKVPVVSWVLTGLMFNLLTWTEGMFKEVEIGTGAETGSQVDTYMFFFAILSLCVKKVSWTGRLGIVNLKDAPNVLQPIPSNISRNNKSSILVSSFDNFYAEINPDVLYSRFHRNFGAKWTQIWWKPEPMCTLSTYSSEISSQQRWCTCHNQTLSVSKPGVFQVQHLIKILNYYNNCQGVLLICKSL